jgi:ABC-2 type transport system permease protein
VAETRATGAIYDIGYQHYDGVRLGRANAIRTLIGFSVHAAFGSGRGQRARIIPLIVISLVYAPVFVQVALAAAAGRPAIINYAQQLEFASLFIALFAASQAPELIVADREFGVLSLYVSRSLRPTDYALAKLAAFLGALLVLTLGPELALFVARLFLSDAPSQAFQANWKSLGPIVGGTTLAAAYIATVALAISSFSTRKAFASASVIAYFVILPALAGISAQFSHGDARRYAVLGNPFQVMTGFANWLFDVQARRAMGIVGRRPIQIVEPLSGPVYLYVILGTCAVALVALLVRYRKIEE